MNINELMGMGREALIPEILQKMNHGDLVLLRKMAEKRDPQFNEYLAPFEHQAFAREYVKENPVTGPLAIGTAIPLYALAKAAGFRNNGTATPPSFQQMGAGFRGIGQGLGLVK